MRIYFFDIYEVGRIDIVGAGRIRPVVLLWKLLISIIEDIGIVLKTVLPRRQSNYETDVFCVWRGRQVFCEFPLEWSFEIVIGEDVLKQGFGYN